MSIEIAPFEKLFNLAEARSLFPLVQSITTKHQTELVPIQQRLNKMLSNDPRRNSVEHEYQQVVAKWRGKIEKLGASVSDLWVVEFDVGEGALCWRHPELSLNYFRAKGDDFSSRVTMQKYVEEYDPDWAH